MLAPDWWFEGQICKCSDWAPSRSISTSLRQADRRITYSRAVSLDSAAIKREPSYGVYFPWGDEPTNHISLALTEELLAALERWAGAVVVASHDRWVRRTWSGDVVSLNLS